MSEALSPHIAATKAGRQQEDIFVGERIVRHRFSSRVIHWSVAGTFVLSIITGMPIWSPIFLWMSWLVGGLHVCRWLHPWTGAAFALASVVMFLHWARDMVMDASEREWLSPTRIISYLQQREDENVGKYNGGQKIFFWAVSAVMVVLFLSGLVLWFPEYFGQMLREAAVLIHDVCFIFFAVSIIGHIYLGTAAGPGTFGAIMHGTVSLAWARLHHPRWAREVTSGPDGRGPVRKVG